MIVIGYIIVSCLLLVCIIALVLFGRFLLLFNHHRCIHCGHSMVFKGERERTEGNIYLFHCNKCGAWDEIPKKDMDARFYDWAHDLNDKLYD